MNMSGADSSKYMPQPIDEGCGQYHCSMCGLRFYDGAYKSVSHFREHIWKDECTISATEFKNHFYRLEQLERARLKQEQEEKERQKREEERRQRAARRAAEKAEQDRLEKAREADLRETGFDWSNVTNSFKQSINKLDNVLASVPRLEFPDTLPDLTALTNLTGPDSQPRTIPSTHNFVNTLREQLDSHPQVKAAVIHLKRNRAKLFPELDVQTRVKCSVSGCKHTRSHREAQRSKDVWTCPEHLEELRGRLKAKHHELMRVVSSDKFEEDARGYEHVVQQLQQCLANACVHPEDTDEKSMAGHPPDYFETLTAYADNFKRHLTNTKDVRNLDRLTKVLYTFRRYMNPDVDYFKLGELVINCLGILFSNKDAFEGSQALQWALSFFGGLLFNLFLGYLLCGVTMASAIGAVLGYTVAFATAASNAGNEAGGVLGGPVGGVILGTAGFWIGGLVGFAVDSFRAGRRIVNNIPSSEAA